VRGEDNMSQDENEKVANKVSSEKHCVNHMCGPAFPCDLRDEILESLNDKDTHYQAVIEGLEKKLQIDCQECRDQDDSCDKLHMPSGTMRSYIFDLQSTNQSLLKEMKGMYQVLKEICQFPEQSVEFTAKQALSSLSESTRKELEK